MAPCGVVSAALAALVACFAFTVMYGGKQLEQKGGEDYQLGSGKMFDAIAPRYDLINKVRQ